MKRYSFRNAERGPAFPFAMRKPIIFLSRDASGWNFWFFSRFMSYALFSQDQQISKAFATAKEVWDHADTAGLVEHYEKDGYPCRALAEQYKVRKIQTRGAELSRKSA